VTDGTRNLHLLRAMIEQALEQGVTLADFREALRLLKVDVI
jgi:hypothetical protein